MIWGVIRTWIKDRVGYGLELRRMEPTYLLIGIFEPLPTVTQEDKTIVMS